MDIASVILALVSILASSWRIFLRRLNKRLRTKQREFRITSAAVQAGIQVAGVTVELNLSELGKIVTKVTVDEDKKAIAENKVQRTLAVSSMQLEDKQKKHTIAFLIIAGVISFHVISRLFWEISSISPYLLIILSIYVIALWLDETLTRFRIRRGLYGNNEFEAREILEYIVSNSDKIDFSGGHKIFDDSHQEEAQPALIPGGEIIRHEI